jgi:alpha-glucosidase
MPRTTSARRYIRPGALQRWWREGRTLFADFGGPLLSVTALTADIVRFRFAPSGTFSPSRSWTVVPPDDSLADDSLGTPAFTVREDGAAVEAATDHLVVRVEPAGRTAVRERETARVILTDGELGGPAWDAKSGAARWTHAMPSDERYYGFGERTGPLDKRGRRYTCWATDRYEAQTPDTDEMYQAIPFYLALNGAGQSYGHFLNNTHRTVFDLTDVEGGLSRIEVDGGELDRYFFFGPEPARALERYTELTGRMPLPPRWALGYHESRWSYESAATALTIAAELRRRRIPSDVIHLDIDYMDAFRVFTWHPERFPDPAGLMSSLRAQGFKVVTIVDPGVKHQPEGGYRLYTEGVERGCFVRRHPSSDKPFLGWVWPGLCAFPDFTRADVRSWWGDWYRGLWDVGVRGILNDMNEPAMHDKPYDDLDGFRTDPPLETPHGSPEEETTHAEVHNVYGHLETRATFEAWRSHRPDERPFLLTRAGFAGVQRYAGIWAGDNQSSWEHLAMSLPQLLNMGLSGLALAGADIGGFFEDCSPELFARWMQLGAFYPFMRSNSAKGTARQEPWSFGERTEKVSRRAIELRYRLLPYLYSVAEEASRTGAPILRPLLYHYAGDPMTHAVEDQALLGPDILIAPVLRPGAEDRALYLPAGVWYDGRSGERMVGGGEVLASASLEMDIPYYLRGGAIVPMGPVLQWSDERAADPMTLHVCPDERGESEGWLYEDDGLSLAYEHGQRWRTHFTCTPLEAGRYRIRATGEGSAAPTPRTIVVRLYGADGVHSSELQPADGSWQLDV